MRLKYVVHRERDDFVIRLKNNAVHRKRDDFVIRVK